MALTFTTSLSGKHFSATIPDVEFGTTASSVAVTMLIDREQIYSETLFPINGKIRLCELSALVTPYVRQTLVAELTLNIRENMPAENGNGDSASLAATVIYCTADFHSHGDVSAAGHFCDTHFLSILLGTKITARHRLEFLHYLGTDVATVTALYSDGTELTFTPPKVQGNDKYTTIDVSPDRFASEGRLLLSFTVSAGERQQRFIMDLEEPDCAPVLIFENSFGCEELIYCTGTHKVAPSYKRSNTFIDGKFRNYEIVEERTFKADTGYLNTAMANWLDDLFRSQMVRVVNFYDGQPDVGKEVTLSDSKSEMSNDDDEMPRFTFSYRYSQRNQNVVDLQRAGRIFDNTFDNTFN